PGQEHHRQRRSPSRAGAGRPAGHFRGPGHDLGQPVQERAGAVPQGLAGAAGLPPRQPALRDPGPADGRAARGAGGPGRRPAAARKSPKGVADIDSIDYSVEPLNPNEKAEALKDPGESGGLLLAMYQYRQLLVYGVKGFVGGFAHGGVEPYYPPTSASKPDYL